MRPEEFEAKEARESEDARHRRLGRGLWRDEDEHSRQQDAPPAFDHLVVVQIRTCMKDIQLMLFGVRGESFVSPRAYIYIF